MKGRCEWTEIHCSVGGEFMKSVCENRCLIELYVNNIFPAKGVVVLLEKTM